MASQESGGPQTSGHEIIGKALVVFGTVQATSPDGMSRTLQPNSPIYLNDRVVTGSSGAVSIVFNDDAGTQLDLGRMSDMVIDQEVFGGASVVDAATAAAEVEQIQQALEAGEEFDPTTELEATAAGPAAGGVGSAGGGQQTVVFELDGREVTPDSGAETTGVEGDFTGTEPGTVPPETPPPVIVAAAAPVFSGAPAVVPDVPETPPPPPIPPTLNVDRIVQEEAMVERGSEYFSIIHEIEGDNASTVDYWHFSVDNNPDPGSWEYVRFNFQAENMNPFPDLDSDHPDGDPNQADLQLHVHIYKNDGSGGLGDFVTSDALNSWDQSVGAWLQEGTDYIFVVGDFPLSTGDASDGSNSDIPPVEYGPYKVQINGNITITQIPDGGYITSMPSLSDGNPDQNDLLEDQFQPDSAVVSGNLGAGSWAISSKAGLPNLSSQGWQIQYELVNNNGSDTDVIRAWAVPDGIDIDDPGVIDNIDVGEIPARLVFTLEVDENGDYRFYQTDQIDNVPPGIAAPNGALNAYEGDLFSIDPGDVEAAEENFEMVLYDNDGNPIGWIDTLDFSQNLQVSFPPGHPSAGTWSFGPGSFTIQSEDDTPIAVNDCDNGIKVWIEEDGMSSGQGWPEGYNLVADQSEGAKLPFPLDSNSQDEASGNYWNGDSIAQLFKVGADEFPVNDRYENEFPSAEAVYGITSNDDIIQNLPKLWSQGEQVQYKVVGDTLVAYVPDPDDDDNQLPGDGPVAVQALVADGAEDYEDLGRIVFTFTVNPDGSWNLDQDDQLDHVDQVNPDSQENWALRSGDVWDGEGAASIPGLDLSSILTVTDFDGDTLVGAGEGQFVVSFQDDVPEFSNTAQAFYVSEFAGYNNLIGTYHLNKFGWPTSNEQILVRSTNEQGNNTQFDNNKPLGEFDIGSKLFIIPDGADVDPENAYSVNIVPYWDGSEWKFAPKIDGVVHWDTPVYFMDNQFNPNNNVHFLDENGQPLTEIPPEGAEIHIEDLPNLGDKDHDDAVIRIQVGPAVSEANLPDGTDPDNAALTVNGNLLTGEGGFKIDPGADEHGTLTVNANSINVFNTGDDLGDPISLVMDGDGGSITVNSETGTLVINDDWTWSYELTGNTLKHPDNDKGGADHTDGDSDRGTGDQLQDVFDLTYEDFDGDSISPQMVININDDGPKVWGASNRMVDETDKLSAHDNFNFDFGADGSTIEIVAKDSDAEWDESTGTLTAADGTYKIVLDPDGTGYTFTQLAPMDHPDTTDHDDKIYLNFEVKVTDGDGDTALDPFRIRVDDDGPDVEVSSTPLATGEVHEDALNDGTTLASSNAGNNPDMDLSAGLLDSSQQTDQTSFNLSDHVTVEDYGYDGPGSLAFSIIDPEGADSGLTTNGGEAVYYYKDADTGNLVARTAPDGENIFEVSLEQDPISGDTKAVFNLNDQLDHIKAGDDGIFGTDDDEPMDPLGDVPAGDAGALVIDNLGQFIQVTITDGDGDTDADTFEGLINVSVENDVPEAVEPDPGVPQNLNLVLVLDRSGSMEDESIEWTDENNNTSQVPRIEALQGAVLALLGSLDSSSAQNIVVHLVDFATSAESRGTFVIKGGDGSDPGLAEAEDVINNLDNIADGFTNWEDGLMVAENWASGSASGIQPLNPADFDGNVVNQVLFISDGDPNRYNKGEGDDEVVGSGGGFSQNALDDVLGQHNSSNNSYDDFVNDAEALENLGYTVRAVGIDVNNNQDDRLDSIDSTDDAVNISSANELISILPALITGGGPIISAQVVEADMDPDADLPVPDYADGTEGPGTGDEATSGTELSALFQPGADEELTYGVGSNFTDLPTLMSDGQAVTYSSNQVFSGGELVSSSLTAEDHNGEAVFTFTVHADGQWDFDLQGALDHVAGNGNNIDLLTGDGSVSGIDLSSVIHAFDTDLDPVQAADGAFIVQVTDDLPDVSVTQNAILANETGNSLKATFVDPGADGIAVLDFAPTQLQTEYGHWEEGTGADAGSWIFVQTVFSKSGQNSDLDQLSILKVTPEYDGSEYTGKYTVEQLNKMMVPKTVEKDFEFPFNGNGSASSKSWTDNGITVTVTGVDPSSSSNNVRWENGYLGVGDNEVEYDGHPDYTSETLIFNFSDANGTVELNSLRVDLDNLGGSSEKAYWKAFDENGGQVGSGSLDGNDDPSDTFTIDPSQDFSKVTLKAGSWDDFNVDKISGTAIEETEVAADVSFEFEATITDGDGDEVTTSFDVSLDGGGNIYGSEEADVISGSSSGEYIDAGGGDDVVAGNGGADYIDGGTGNDVIYGGEGDDTLLGGDNNDQLVGGEGDDALFGEDGEDILIGDDVEILGDGSLDIVEDGESEHMDGGPDHDIVVDAEPNPPEPDPASAPDTGGNEVVFEGDGGTGDDIIDNLVPPPEIV